MKIHQIILENKDTPAGLIRKYYNQIAAQGDDAIEFMYYDSPIFAQYWDEYEGDLDSIIAEVEPSELQIILDELEAAAEDQGVAEGYTVTRGIDRERYQERPGLEGPFSTRSGKVVYYDPKEGKYYDPETDFYIDHDDYAKMDEGVAEGWTKLPSGDYQKSHTGVRTSKPPVQKKVRGYKWEVHFDYGPHMSDSVVVTAASENEARAKAEKAAEKAGRDIMINWAKPVEQGMAEETGQRVVIVDGPEMYVGKTGVLGTPSNTALKPGYVMVNLDHGGGSVMLPKEAVKAQGVAEGELNEITTGDYYKKATMQRAQAGMGAGFARSPEEREKHMATYNKRDAGLNRLKDRRVKADQAAQVAHMADLVTRLPELRAEYEAMQAEYKALGGSNWQYADREQNLTDRERKARGMEGPMNNLWRQIQAAEKAQEQQGLEEAEHEFTGANGPLSVRTEPGRTIVKRKEWNQGPGGAGDAFPGHGESPKLAFSGQRKADYDSGDYSDDAVHEGEKIGNMDADKFDAAMARLKKLAGAGPLKTVYDPAKRVYKNIPTAVQPKK